MKHLPLLCLFLMLLSYPALQAQQNYTVSGTTYSLKTEVEGTLTLLWNTIDGEYRYFSKKGNDIVELKNSKTDGDYQEEYKEVLRSQTADAVVAVEDVNLTLPSLRAFFIAYNKKIDPAYSVETVSIQLKTRLGGFAGLSNNAYFFNPDNSFLPVLGVEFEIIDDVRLRRHAIVFQFRQLISSSDYDFSSSQVSFNYRFKFIKTDRFDAFINAKPAAFTSISRNQILVEGEEVTTFSGGSEFQFPGSFGIGFDHALGNGYLTFLFNDVVAINLDDNGEFPLELTLGYKWNL
ncbi:hypothetical protein [Altibacter sp.]|uniref:hypothetical protein n=1 Tax=Altibacter sp. TaxID=2024823 RepID=UPI00258DDD5A|nr:hypothetical protein [Altibacter sp.]MCW9037062.1 hypothetical protein [Altibacter sp.]